MANQLPRRIAKELDIWDIKIGKFDKIDLFSLDVNEIIE